MRQKKTFWLWVGIVILIWVAIRTSGNIMRLYEAGGRVDRAEKELVELKNRKEEVERKLEESQKNEYKERIARERLGLGLPGEVVVIMDDAQKSNDPMIQLSNGNEANWQKWRKLYLGFF